MHGSSRDARRMVRSAIDDASNWGATNAPTQDAGQTAALAYCTGANPRLLDSIFAGN